MEATLDIALDAARVGGEVLMSYFRGELDIRNKAVADMVSDADVTSEQRIVALLRESFPDHAVLGEEGEGSTERLDPNAEPHLWVIDPLDGTTNFVHQIPHFAVSVGYYEYGVGKVGVVLNPATGDLFHAVQGQGAFHNGTPIHVNTSDELNQALVGVGFYYDRGAMMRKTLDAIGEFFSQNIHGIRRFGTASLDLCQVATGRYGVFFEYVLSPWDFAAGAIVVREAGGQVTTCSGEDLQLESSTLLASNGALHHAALEITQRNLPDG